MLLPAIIELADAPHTIVENVFEYTRLNLGGLTVTVTAPLVVVVVATTVCCFCETDSEEGTVIVMLMLPVAVHHSTHNNIMSNSQLPRLVD